MKCSENSMENMHTDFWVMISNRKETPCVHYCPFRFWELINVIRNHFITDVRDDPTTFKLKSLYPKKGQEIDQLLYQ